jgi:hypothetical protein
MAQEIRTMLREEPRGKGHGLLWVARGRGIGGANRRRKTGHE